MPENDTTFFDGFAWPIPSGFSAALSNCRFGGGDTFYDDPSAYSLPWGAKGQKFSNGIQVRFPETSAVGPIGDADAQFNSSWGSSATVDIFDREGVPIRRQVPTTQGGIYNVLWKGNLAALDSTESLEIPASWKEVGPKLDGAEQRVRELYNKYANVTATFFFAADVSTVPHVEKIRKVRSCLSGIAQISELATPPADLGVELRVRPTVFVCSFGIEAAEEGRVTAALKQALYNPTKASGSKKESFSLKRHGALIKV